MLYLWPVPVHASFVHASVNGLSLDLAGPRVTVRSAARAAGVPLRTGMMRAVTGEALAVGVRPPDLWRNGERATARTEVRTGDRIRVENHEDYLEPSDAVVQPIPVGGF